ncbi:MAG: RNA polymerase sigma-70 factor [Prolixibacteraceae bacterium]
MTVINDNELILSLSEGDVKAFNELFIRYHLRVYRFAINILHSKNDAEEVVQEVFIAVWQNRHRIKPEGFTAYLFGIARNQVHSLVRKYVYFDRYLLFLEKNKEFVHNPVEEQIDFDAVQNFFSEQIDRLPERRKAIFCMSRFDQLNYKEIAQKLKISENTVDSQIRHALDTLRKEYVKNFS